MVLAAAALIAAGCAGQDSSYRPAPQILPSNIKKVAVRMVANKTQQYGMEDKLMLDITNDFLADGSYAIVPEADADGVVVPTITRYILTPIQFDSTLIPTVYKLDILLDLEFVDRATNTALWEEKNMEASENFPASIMPNGKTEEQAREDLWTQLATQIVTRVVQGFGTVTGTSQRWITGDAPSTAPAAPAAAPVAPVTSPY